MSIAGRIIKLEDRLKRRPQEPAIDWQPYLARLTDAQLDRLEELCVKAGANVLADDRVEAWIDRLEIDEMKEVEAILDACIEMAGTTP